MIGPTQVYPEGPSENTYGFGRCCEAVREAVPLEHVARRYTTIKPLGGNARFKGRCPLPDHEDPTPSFYIYPDRRYWCFGCSRGGDVIDLEFFCGDYSELWEAMISLAVDYGVDLPQRPSSWHRKLERQQPIRDGIEAAKVYAARRRLYKWCCEPLVLATEDEEDRAHDAHLYWEATAKLAEHLVANMMGRQQ
jgi:CHC2 zinc finger